MWRRAFQLESLNLVRALTVQDAAWVSARIAPLPQLVPLSRYWLELRDDVLILYPASRLLYQHNIRSPTDQSRSKLSRHNSSSLDQLEALSNEQLSALAALVPPQNVSVFVLQTTKIYSKREDSCIFLKSRSHRTSARLIFESRRLVEKWRSHFASAVRRERKHLSDFEIVRHVGKGASGRVYEVIDKTNGERLALKVIEKATVFESEDTYRHAMDERIVLQMIRDHPFILDMRYAFQNAKRLFLVTEFCGGGDLFEYMNRKVAPLDEETAKHVAAEVLLAIEHLHSLGVVYRDLKLENILIDDDGHTRLADFGLTKVLKQDDGTLRRTRTFCGTREYVAPEMLRGDSYDTTIDFWTFGILLYEMLSGRTPFYTSDHNEIYRRIEKAPIFYPRNLSPDVRSVLGKLLRRDPHQRLGAGQDGFAEIKQHEWFKNIDWDALLQKSTQSPLKKHIDFFSKRSKSTPASSTTSARKNKRQQKQEKALVALLADVKEDMKYVSSLSITTPIVDLSSRPKSPLEKRGAGILAGYAFCNGAKGPSGFGSSAAFGFSSGLSSFMMDSKYGEGVDKERKSETVGVEKECKSDCSYGSEEVSKRAKTESQSESKIDPSNEGTKQNTESPTSIRGYGDAQGKQVNDDVAVC